MVIKKYPSPLKVLAQELLTKYELEREMLIYEQSTNIQEDKVKLRMEVQKYKQELGKYE